MLVPETGLVLSRQDIPRLGVDIPLEDVGLLIFGGVNGLERDLLADDAAKGNLKDIFS